MALAKKILKVGNSWGFTIPRVVLSLLGWTEGQEVELLVNPDKTLTIKPVKKALFSKDKA